MLTHNRVSLCWLVYLKQSLFLSEFSRPLYFEQAIHYLEESVRIFSKEVDEPIRLWEAQNELGSTYRDWGNLVQAVHQEAAERKYNEAQIHYDQSLKVAQDHHLHFQLADTYDDLAQLANNRGNAEMGAYWLEQINIVVSNDHRNSLVQPGNHLEQGDAYLLVLAKVNWQKAIQHLLQLKQDGLTKSEKEQTTKASITHFAQAIVYFQKYWPDTSLVKSRYEKMMSLGASSQIPTNTITTKLNEMTEHYQCNLNFLFG